MEQLINGLKVSTPPIVNKLEVYAFFIPHKASQEVASVNVTNEYKSVINNVEIQPCHSEVSYTGSILLVEPDRCVDEKPFTDQEIREALEITITNKRRR